MIFTSPFENAEQKIFGLGYNLLAFVYDKIDSKNGKIFTLKFMYCALIRADRTADYTTTKMPNDMLNQGANKEDIMALIEDRNLPVEEIARELIADKIINTKPKQGHLTISNALQWRLQYSKVITLSNSIDGIQNYEWK